MALCCDKTTHFRVAFYCLQHKVHLCNDHAVEGIWRDWEGDLDQGYPPVILKKNGDCSVCSQCVEKEKCTFCIMWPDGSFSHDYCMCINYKMLFCSVVSCKPMWAGKSYKSIITFENTVQPQSM